ncbi:carbohydrate esterase family 9 protein [Moniliophthora roreri MCA 2997]|uniref:Carbohydrate esterase family 9 protein n=2 Tax=Moniliophthora roreri TaxID=221103 RepID=V2XNJ1_MONRO|nr:carbohydrate esterase family 9 protein [Moniliophthora roreri MCA 2997]
MSSNYILDEARKAYHFGLPESAALASVTSAPAIALGLSHRIGILRKGSDADLVIWDSHPLHMGATPLQVWIDGTLQNQQQKNFNSTIQRLKEGHAWRKTPIQPNYDMERKSAIKNEGRPFPSHIIKGKVVFMNVKEVWNRKRGGYIEELFPAGQRGLCVVVVEKGKITCLGEGKECSSAAEDAQTTIDLDGGSISPGLLTFGSRLGLEEMASEPSTGDGMPYNAFAADVPRILQDVGGLVKASDALMFGTLHARRAYISGVTFAASCLMYPLHAREGDDAIIWGLSTAFRTGANHAFDRGAIVQDVVALNIRITRPSPFGLNAGRGISVSEQIAGIRRLLYGWEGTQSDTGKWFRAAAEGRIPLVIEVHNVDIMASLLIMKAEVDERIGGEMRMVFVGASEAHLLAKEISNANVGVILTSITPDFLPWDARRMIPGPPLTNHTILGILLKHDVAVGIGVEHPQFAQDTKFHLSQISEIEAQLDRETTYGLASTTLEKLLGVKGLDEETGDLVAFHQGSVFDSGSKPVAVISPLRATVDVF